MRTLFIGALVALTPACILAPEGLKSEREHAELEGRAFREPFEARVLPDLPDEPGWRDLLRRAFLANGDLEAAWQSWRAALSRVERESAWPNTPLQLGFEYLFSPENMKAWDRTTLTAGFDPAMMLELPTKSEQRGEVALADAREKGEIFRAAKFDLQERLLGTWLDLARLEEETRIRAEEVALLRMRAESALRAAGAGGDERELLRIQLELKTAENAVARLKSMCTQVCVELVAMAGGPSGVAIHPPRELEAPRTLPLQDGELFQLAAQSNPTLLELAHAMQGRDDALELARMEYLPDVSPFGGVNGSISQFAGFMLTLPTNFSAIGASVEAARADLARSQALARQARTDVAARITAELLALRDAERATAWLANEVRPIAERLARSAEIAYSSGTIAQREWLEMRRAVLEVRLALADARTAREKSLARLERLVGVDFETIAATEVNRG